MKPSWRNLILFALVTLGSGFVGAGVNALAGAENPMEGPGTLIWLTGPLIAQLLLRAFGGDGWRESGFGLGGLKAWPTYLAAIWAPLLTAAIALAVAVALGIVSPNALTSGDAALTAFGVAFAAAAVKNIFEEGAWRGYLTPKLEALRAPAPLTWIVTGVIWASWHIPYYLYFLDPQELAKQTTLGPAALTGLALLMLPLQSIAYGELRLRSGSIWPAWLMHTIANALSTLLFVGGLLTPVAGLSALLSPGTEGIVYGVVLGGIGLALWRARIRASAGRP